ncbi:MAG: multinuclear nonheme iron-dependent oxidase [Leptospirales bacterium]
MNSLPRKIPVPDSLASLPHMGIGLSTDLYFPPLEDLVRSFSKDKRPDYLEVFRGRTQDLKEARNRIIPDSIGTAYHGDTLWYTQPDFPENPGYTQEIARVNRHLDALRSPWMIHECAHKSILGRTFGSYLPPVLEGSSARWIRTNALQLQSFLRGRSLLLEIPPFPMFSLGNLSPGDFFRMILDGTDLGMGLDIGHAMTAYRLERDHFDPEDFALWIRTTFPTSHIVQIHAGGLAPFKTESGIDFWDDHSRPIPDLLWESLETVLTLVPLPALKGVALEVDNKDIPTIILEFSRFRTLVSRFWTKSHPPEPVFHSSPHTPSQSPMDPMEPALFRNDSRALQEGLYRSYIDTLLGQDTELTIPLKGDPSRFRKMFYPDEIWRFGGYIPDLFPETLGILSHFIGDIRQEFISFFHTVPVTELEPYDFLRTKVTLIQIWIQNLTNRNVLVGKVAQRALEMAHKEGSRILIDQEWINGDPCPQQSFPENCPADA